MSSTSALTSLRTTDGSLPEDSRHSSYDDDCVMLDVPASSTTASAVTEGVTSNSITLVLDDDKQDAIIITVKGIFDKLARQVHQDDHSESAKVSRTDFACYMDDVLAGFSNGAESWVYCDHIAVVFKAYVEHLDYLKWVKAIVQHAAWEDQVNCAEKKFFEAFWFHKRWSPRLHVCSVCHKGKTNAPIRMLMAKWKKEHPDWQNAKITDAGPVEVAESSSRDKGKQTAFESRSTCSPATVFGSGAMTRCDRNSLSQSAGTRESPISLLEEDPTGTVDAPIPLSPSDDEGLVQTWTSLKLPFEITESARRTLFPTQDTSHGKEEQRAFADVELSDTASEQSGNPSPEVSSPMRLSDLPIPEARNPWLLRDTTTMEEIIASINSKPDRVLVELSVRPENLKALIDWDMSLAEKLLHVKAVIKGMKAERYAWTFCDLNSSRSTIHCKRTNEGIRAQMKWIDAEVRPVENVLSLRFLERTLEWAVGKGYEKHDEQLWWLCCQVYKYLYSWVMLQPLPCPCGVGGKRKSP